MQNFRTRQSCSDQPQPSQGVTAARDFLFSQYSSIPGLQVRLDPFVHPSCPSSPTFNVIAWLPGKRPNQLVIVGGHYDSRTSNVNDATSNAPGGNDAGAQTAVVLELANDRVHVLRRRRAGTVRFCLDRRQSQPLLPAAPGYSDAQHGHTRRRQHGKHFFRSTEFPAVFARNPARTAQYRSRRHDRQHFSFPWCDALRWDLGGELMFPRSTCFPNCAKIGRAAPAITHHSSITASLLSV